MNGLASRKECSITSAVEVHNGTLFQYRPCRMFNERSRWDSCRHTVQQACKQLSRHGMEPHNAVHPVSRCGSSSNLYHHLARYLGCCKSIENILKVFSCFFCAGISCMPSSEIRREFQKKIRPPSKDSWAAEKASGGWSPHEHAASSALSFL